MAMAYAELESMIAAAFPEAEFELTDLVGDNDHYALKIESPRFRGKSRVQQHKMVYDALNTKVGGELHALQLKTVAPVE